MRASFSGALALTSIFLLPTSVLSQACAETGQNPHCDPSFANLICCPYPNVCYWADRQKTPGCCAQGSVCGVGGGGAITVPPPALTTTQGPPPTETTTLGGVVGTVTSDVVGVFSTVTSGAVGVYSTITSGVVGVYSTVTSGVVGVYTTVTSAVGGAFATVSGVLVGGSPPQAELDPALLMLPALVTMWTLAGAGLFYLR